MYINACFFSAKQEKMSDSEDFKSTHLSTKQIRRSYLVTYSQADFQLFPTREYFGSAVVEAFNAGSAKVKVDYWSSALEDHKDGGKYFHIALKLSGPKKVVISQECLKL